MRNPVERFKFQVSSASQKTALTITVVEKLHADIE